MPGLIDSASMIISSAENRMEAIAQNIANSSTAGFKRQASFSEALNRAEVTDGSDIASNYYHDFSQGRLSETRNPWDLAIHGPALFMLRDDENILYSRGGHFSVGMDGIVQDNEGRILQQAGGSDFSVKGASVEILDDGTVLEDGRPTAQLALYEPVDAGALTALGGSVFKAPSTAMAEASNSQIRQGFAESSNVVASDEMIAMMSTIRQAESGARVAQFYDQLIGQAITTFRNSR